MSKWIVVTEVESEVDPAVFSYVNGTILISSKLKGKVMTKGCACDQLEDYLIAEGWTCYACYEADYE